MLKLLLVGLSKSERRLWAKSNSKVLDFSPSTERRDEGHEKIIVYEYAECGSLDKYLTSSNT